MSTWETRKKASANWNSVGESASRQREIILKNNDTISGHFQSTVTENFWIVPRNSYIMQTICRLSLVLVIANVLGLIYVPESF